jgi:GH25 family lysozyme M1 (1,4-beta-N-acetylmuramidase)
MTIPTTTSAPGTGTAGSAAPRLQHGVDVAVFQGDPSSWAPLAGDIDWAAVKLTELEPKNVRYVNPDAAADWDWLAQQGKGRIAYLFGHPSVSASDTVNFFVSELNSLGLKDTDGIALDLETSDGLSAADVASWAGSVLAQLASTLQRAPVLYTYIDFAAAGNCAGLGSYPLWIADPSDPAGSPRVPEPWKTWAIHQYASTDNLDRDVANYPSQAAMFAALGKRSTLPPLKNLGGDVVSAVASARWPDGQLVVAGLSKDGYVQVTRWDNSSWSGWIVVSPGRSTGAPGLLAWPSGQGRLYYVNESGAVVEMDTVDSGQTWT